MKEFMKEFKAQSLYQIEQNIPRLIKCFDQLNEEEIWEKPNESLNSVGNLMIHLCGNIRQYAISSLGRKPDNRKRDEEFSVDGGYTKRELLDMLEDTIHEAKLIIIEATEDDLLKDRTVQGFNYSGIGIMIHVTEHFSYHTGQIAFWTKQLKNRDLGFFADRDLNIKNDD